MAPVVRTSSTSTTVLPASPAAQHGAQEQAVGFQDAADLDQRAGQVVDPVERHGAHHQVEAVGGEGQRLLVGHHGGAGGALGERLAEVAADELPDGRPMAEYRGDLVAMAAEIERQVEVPAHVVQPFDEALGNLALEEGLALPAARRAVAPPAQHGAVEDQEGVGSGHGPYVRRKCCHR